MNLFSQAVERPRPAEWNNLVYGARFLDRFLPMPQGKLSGDVWGAKGTVPRYIDNGIEDGTYSYWGGNILRDDDGKYNFFVCGWLESSPKGHAEWPNSIVFRAVSDNSVGPFTVKDSIGKGHNPEIFQTKDGQYVIYVMGGRYVANKISGPWTYGRFDFDRRDRKIIDGLSNLTFARREDGSFLMINRGGGVWISETGLSPYRQLSDKRVYPAVEGAFEDPVVWRDHVQYHLIVNDWLGRIAFYLRSKDGVKWVVDPGEAYIPGISKHEDGRIEEWFKYERMKVFQDEYGRVVQANFAVIDTLKKEDKPNDRHSSKNISIPLNPGLLLAILNEQPVTATTKTIRLKIFAEKGFNPHTDIDLQSLRFGASSEVNFGRGCRVKNTEKAGNDLIVTFDAVGNGITADEFAPKLIGKTVSGSLLYGYVRLPGTDYIEPILSARAPIFTVRPQAVDLSIEVGNFGQVASQETTLKIAVEKDGGKVEIGNANLPALKAYEKTTLMLPGKMSFDKGKEYSFRISIHSNDREVSAFDFKTVPVK
ncbi:MAG: glycoside hydrolase family protein [Prevotellaceae bacterium]|nr:glycoside hydrolase family protein [Prevotellaceae bacterium]